MAMGGTDSQWQFSDTELESSPSRRDGVNEQQEKDYRRKTVSLRCCVFLTHTHTQHTTTIKNKLRVQTKSSSSSCPVFFAFLLLLVCLLLVSG
jgi:hypothetical protein